MALSASVGNLLRWAPAGAGGDWREAFDKHRSQNACVSSRCKTGILNGSGRNGLGLGTGGRLRCRRQRERFPAVRASDNNSSNQSGETETTSSEVDVEALEARLGVGRRARNKQQAESGGLQSPAKPKQPAKKWESMSLVEKAWSLYIDPDKGVLFWLNKLAYGAIFTVIGGWIVFRFIGPALGLYELDQNLLSPDKLLDGP